MTLGVVALTGFSCADAPTDGEEEPTSSRPEFEDLAARLRSGDNPYVGVARLGQLREQVQSVGLPLPRAVGARVAFSQEALKHGRVDEAVAMVDEAFLMAQSAGASPQMLAPLRRARAIANLRAAEVENCIKRHNRDCCIFPLADGGVHAIGDPVSRAAEDYRALLELDPSDLGVRWLFNLCHQALGDWPQAVPSAWLVPPEAFASAYDIGRFRDIASDLGVDANNLCGGSVVEDFDGDGDLDIATSTFDVGGPLLLYRSEDDGSFTDASDEARTSEQLGGLNVISGDYDSDGDVDLLVLRGAWLLDDGRIRNSLLENDGTGVFRDVTRAAGLALPAAPTQAACWGDYDSDGDLDLFVGNESRMRTRGDGDYPSQLWRNEGDGTFVDVAEAAGVRNNAFCKGACWGDYDNDGDLDLYLSNIKSNRLLQNQGDGTFRGVARAAGVALQHRTFATWFFDYDNDGWLDLFVTSYDATLADVCADHLGQRFDAHPPSLFHNRGDGTFEDVALTHGLNHAWLPMGANFGDLDNDGWLDIYLATGDPKYESLVPNAMLRNDAGRGFQDVTTSGGFGHLQKGHGVSFADIDSDGDQDIYHQLGGFYPGDGFHNALFENPGHGNHFLVLELRGVESHASGSGARVEVRVKGPGGERSIHRAPGCVSSFGGSPARLELGLGDAEEVVSLKIRWPVSGETDSYSEIPMDARVRATEGGTSLERLPYEPVPNPRVRNATLISPPPREPIHGVYGFTALSKIGFKALPNSPHQLSATYAFPDRARWYLEPANAGRGQRSVRYRSGPQAWELPPGSGEAAQFEGDQATQAFIQLELRRAAMLWPLGFDWEQGTTPGQGVLISTAEIGTGGLLGVRRPSPEAPPSSFFSELPDGSMFEELRDMEWTDGPIGPRPAAWTLVSSGTAIWTETIESMDTNVRFVDAHFLPPHLRELPNKGKVDSILLVEVPKRFRQRRALEAKTWRAALDEAREVIHSTTAGLPSALVDPSPVFELSPEGNPETLLIRLMHGGANPPKGWEEAAGESALARLSPNGDLPTHAMIQELIDARPEGTAGGTPRLRVTYTAEGIDTTQLLLPLSPSDLGD